jgi:predicted Zn-dependent protease
MKHLFILVILAGCSAEQASPGDDLESVEVAEYGEDRGCGASTKQRVCGWSGSHPLTIDPSWSSADIETIRAAAKWWETAVGVDLGSLPISTVDCSTDTKISACITLADRCTDLHIGGQVQVYIGSIESANARDHLAHIVAHEIGHYLGARHSASGVMGSKLGTGLTALTQSDIDAYSEACHE